MKGLWKLNTATWKKDIKRKKTNKKHLIKDNRKFILKNDYYHNKNIPERILRHEKKFVILLSRKEARRNIKDENKYIFIYTIELFLENTDIYLGKTKVISIKKNNQYVFEEVENNNLFSKFDMNTIEIRNIKSIDKSLNPYYKENKEYNNELIEIEFVHANKKSYIYNQKIEKKPYKYKYANMKKLKNRKLRHLNKQELKNLDRFL